LITIKKGSVMFAKKLLNNACFYVIWYAKNKGAIKYRQLFTDKNLQWFAGNTGSHLWAENTKTKECRKATPVERSNINEFLDQDPDWRIFGTWSLNAQGTEKQKAYHFEGKDYYPPRGTQWKTSYPDGLDKLKDDNRLLTEGNTLRVKLYPEDYPVMAINNIWEGIGAASNKIYVVQTSGEIARRCLLMTTDPGDLVFDPTCGSGTTAFVAEQWGRRWITCDTSRVALTLAKQRLMTAVYDYYELAHPQEGVGSGFKYKTVPHVTLGSIARNEPPVTETLYDRPTVNRKITRVTGPFTVEAVPAPAVKSVDDLLLPSPVGRGAGGEVADASVARSGETLRQAEWRDELLKTGLRGKAGQHIRFARLEPLPGCRWLHADGETRPSAEGADSVREEAPAYDPMRAVVSFGPEHAPLEQRQVASALEEAQTLVPRPKLVIFAAFQFDPEAARDIDETNWPGVTLLKAQMNADLLTGDLKKKRSSNESFWLIGQPDVRILPSPGRREPALSLPKGAGGEVEYQVEVLGFDYYNTKTGNIESGGVDKIAVWLLDTDFDGRSLFPRQVFFPLAGPKEGWARLARNLKAEIDPDLIEAYRGTVSLPFEPGEHRRIAVKIVDDRGIESLKVVEVDI
ncbi:MAG TPA: site-specific DNA-methyltransferase, partial [Thermoflexia bacterium]|nr:site-specific DNA-methyltransferase [Thermoflexia bacterium]